MEDQDSNRLSIIGTQSKGLSAHRENDLSLPLSIIAKLSRSFISLEIRAVFR
ncbi:hypothetical protein [Fodinibius sp. AD559]|uniref:hypothetical protein n=1 Tax=Fodinibius sp. AD559 TaxID=3424179 RepID=UPI004046FD68